MWHIFLRAVPDYSVCVDNIIKKCTGIINEISMNAVKMAHKDTLKKCTMRKLPLLVLCYFNLYLTLPAPSYIWGVISSSPLIPTINSSALLLFYIWSEYKQNLTSPGDTSSVCLAYLKVKHYYFFSYSVFPPLPSFVSLFLGCLLWFQFGAEKVKSGLHY